MTASIDAARDQAPARAPRLAFAFIVLALLVAAGLIAAITTGSTARDLLDVVAALANPGVLD
ncbi:MAG: hypothetical protein AAGB29_14715, partial [Planctomycetota bacterium]